MEYKLTVKALESKIKGVKHFSTLNEAILYVELKYKIEMRLNREIPGYTRGSWNGAKEENGTKLEAYAPQGAWHDDVHELEIKATNEKKGYYDKLIEFVTFERFTSNSTNTYDSSYRHTFRNYDKEYNFD